ncbi:ABC transporter substrate-binding protein [Mesorhizobium sp. M4B.F.Ca.ET.143.01.1.1]|uniref:ABC transporter substrate-binding protein n=2 Tax=unclassified Mesorhizobium TaxID=325217 RepID=UPI000FE91F7B|nr:ABC transporter substrate-binding protein [Mesorhizobium sp. M4B.F.Ca.ET.143.01.1.1]RWB93760.1 MAG: ABC transporter substrate-binding protein [Mesorhizobium sp.]TGV18168.1 ABC transporter substrate-binding protein [Mesorhizobium sp. M4B.F.Ca.ET.143.01.1.1]
MTIPRKRCIYFAAAITLLAMSSPAAHADDRPLINVALQSIGSAAGSLENTENYGTAARKVQNSIFEQLIALDLGDPNLTPKPGLATEWHWIEPNVLEFKLGEGVKFQNGDTMTADDVVFSFSDERFGLLPAQVKARESGQTTFTREDGTKGIVPPAVTAASRVYLPLLKSVEKVNDLTVRFVMSEPSLDVEARLARLNYASIISKRAFREASDWQEFVRAPVGTGPYKVASFEPGATIRLVAHDDYWGGRPPLRELVFHIVPEAASRINGLISGEYDIVSDIGPDQASLVTSMPGFDLVGGPVANIRYIQLDERNGPLRNPLVRQALSYSIDRGTITKTLWNDLTNVTPGFQLPLLGKFFLEDHALPKYDPERAKQLLAAAGYKGEPITYQVQDNYYPNELTVAQFNLENLRAIGFNIDFSVTDRPNETSDKRMMFDISNTVHFAHPMALLEGWCPNGSDNSKTNPNGMWQNDEFDSLCTVLRTTTDVEKARSAFRRMLEIIEYEDPGFIVLHQNAILYGKRANISWKPSAIFAMPFGPGAIHVQQ